MSEGGCKSERGGQKLAQCGCTEPRTAVVEGFKVPEQALGFISSENRVNSQNVPLFEGWADLTSPDCGTARARGRKRQGKGECCPEPQRLTGLG
jgi:hypothetical protein